MQPNNNGNPLGDFFNQFAHLFQGMQNGLQNPQGNGNNFGLGNLTDFEEEGTAGNGAVKVTINGAGEVTEVKLDPKVVDKNDIPTLQDLIVTALGDGRQKLQNAAMDKVKNMGNFGGLGNLFGGLFGNFGANNNTNNNNNNSGNNGNNTDKPKDEGTKKAPKKNSDS